MADVPLLSEVARYRKQIDLEHESSHNALFGLACGVSRHDFIEAKAAQGADRILQLIHEGKREEAIHLMHKPDWGEIEDARSDILQ